MIGIYKYQNTLNGRCYIGQSINLEQRRSAHKSSAFNEKSRDYNSQFHQAIRKYGLEYFDYEILEEISPADFSHELLNELEIYYIKKYDSYHNGYNATPGGDNIPNRAQKGEKNGRALLTEMDVRYIRECYNNHITFREVYAQYKDKISKRGLQKIWWFDTWKNIHPEYHNEENRYWHSHQAKALPSEMASQNFRKFTSEQVRAMRADYNNGLTPKQVWLKYAPDSSWSTIYNIITLKTYKDIK